MSHYDKNYSYVEMIDAFHSGRKSMLYEIQFAIKPELGTWALEWLNEYTKARDNDEETKRIDTIVEAEQEKELLNDESND